MKPGSTVTSPVSRSRVDTTTPSLPSVAGTTGRSREVPSTTSSTVVLAVVSVPVMRYLPGDPGGSGAPRPGSNRLATTDRVARADPTLDVVGRRLTLPARTAGCPISGGTTPT